MRSGRVKLRGVVGLTVLGQAEAELPEVGALVGEKAVERVVEHRRYQLPHDRNSVVSGRLGTAHRLHTWERPSDGSDSLVGRELHERKPNARSRNEARAMGQTLGRIPYRATRTSATR